MEELNESKTSQFFTRLKLKSQSKKLEKLFNKIKHRAITIPGEDKDENLVRKMRTMIWEALLKIRKIEINYIKSLDKAKHEEDPEEKVKIEKEAEAEARTQVKKSKEKLKMTIRILKEKKIIGIKQEDVLKIVGLLQSFISLGIMTYFASQKMLDPVKKIVQKAESKEDLIKDYINEEYILEGLKHFKFSQKVERLIDKLRAKSFKLPHEKKTKRKGPAESAIHTLKDEILKPVKRIEKKYDNKTISRKKAVAELKKLKIKLKEVVRYIQDQKLLSRIDWYWIIGTAMWVPIAISGSVDLINNYLMPALKPPVIPKVK
jgi:hypothetical protein